MESELLLRDKRIRTKQSNSPSYDDHDEFRIPKRTAYLSLLALGVVAASAILTFAIWHAAGRNETIYASNVLSKYARSSDAPADRAAKSEDQPEIQIKETSTNIYINRRLGSKDSKEKEAKGPDNHKDRSEKLKGNNPENVAGNSNANKNDKPRKDAREEDGDEEDKLSKSIRKAARDKEEERLRYHMLVADQIFAENIDEYLKYICSEEHMAGTKEGLERADWIHKKFKSFGFDAVLDKKYRVLLSYPVGPGNITVFDKDGKESEKMTVIEKELNEFERKAKKILPPFLAYSASGSVEGELIYANYGSERDFMKLKESNISVKDKIVLVRYGRLSRNKKIKYAEWYGAKGALLYSDPENYSPSGVVFPESWYLPGDGVQRGTLLRMKGDPLTRGYPSLEGLYTRPISEVAYFPKIPVQPMGYAQAERLLRFLDGRPALEKDWSGLLNITYHVNSKDHRKVKLHVNVTREKRNIVNVIGVIRGAEEPDRTVLVGNHRDSWAYGAADPSSGTAVQVEIARALGWLRGKGWRPRRTIMFCSWDAEEFGLIGSTEWVEEHAKVLSHHAVAYINLDKAVQGNRTIELKSTPALKDTFFDAAKRFKDPTNQNVNLFDQWVKMGKLDKKAKSFEPKVDIFKEGSDYMPFFGTLGVPSMDARYHFSTTEQGVYNYPVYHTLHDNYFWLKKFIDPDMRYHTTLAKVMTQVVLQLADSVLLPFNLVRYGDSIVYRMKRLERTIKKAGLGKKLDISLLKKASYTLQDAAVTFHARLMEIDKTDPLAVRIANDQMILFERTFVTSEDPPEEPSTRHVYHTAGLRKAVQAIVDKKPNATEEFLVKYSIYTYHINMAIHALRNPFTYVNRGPGTESIDKGKNGKGKYQPEQEQEPGKDD